VWREDGGPDMTLPGGRRIVWAALALAVAVAAVVAGVLLTRGDSPESVREAAGDTVMAQPEPEDAAGPSPSAEPVPPDSTPVEKPEITPQATALKEQKIPENEGLRPEEAVAGKPPRDGCDHNYGESRQCVPWTFPDGITEPADKCLWLELNGFTAPIKVVGADRQKLDTDGNKIACDG
jgi:hypothetical protein